MDSFAFPNRKLVKDMPYLSPSLNTSQTPQLSFAWWEQAAQGLLFMYLFDIG